MTAARCSVVIAFAFLVLLTDYEATRTTQLPLMLMTVVAIGVAIFNGALIYNRIAKPNK
ncbi:hypothetical protein AB6E39_14235 [Vibrio splendidus]|uniref:hypothetical protein n=1 Tax=Vibrio splendidus TaxID=29497 RepID=UPI001E4E3BCA|nr:hypothetical protein [Vibrio splendidus]MCC4789089.1 hypothetical protein [Vibrio splendidus]CAK2044283.1 conserved hypothetical protein [Vibrio crassostreae]